MSREKVVSKFSSSLVASRDTGVFAEKIDRYVSGVFGAHPERSHVIVTSGARETGLYRARRIYGAEKASKMSNKVLAGLGSTTVFAAFEQAAEKVSVAASSFEITHHQIDGNDDPETQAESRSAIEFIDENAEMDITSILNEGHAFNNAELMRLLIGSEHEIDNDGLAAHIAIASGARYLDIWTQNGGIRDDSDLYVPEVNFGNIDELRGMLAARDGSETGRGGPLPKLDAVWDAALAGVEARILGVNADMSGENITRIVVG